MSKVQYKENNQGENDFWAASPRDTEILKKGVSEHLKLKLRLRSHINIVNIVKNFEIYVYTSAKAYFDI